MPVKIIKADEPMRVERVTFLIMGQPGVGKTTLAFTAAKPLLLDFDKGSYRAPNRADVVGVNSWADVQGLSREDLAGYETLVVDTAGRALDSLMTHIVRSDSRMATRAGAPTLEGYGALKAGFKRFLDKMLFDLSVDVVLLAHAVEETGTSGSRVVRADMTGGSRDEIYKSADQMGFLRMHGVGDAANRHLSYDPSETGYGKNAGNLPSGAVPDIATAPDFLAQHIAGVKTALNRRSDDQKAELERLDLLRNKVGRITTGAGFTELAQKMTKAKAKATDRRILVQEAKTKGWLWNKKDGKFQPDPDNPPIPDTPAEPAPEEAHDEAGF